MDLSEEFILAFLQIPKEVEDALRAQAIVNGNTWINFLNRLYREFVPNIKFTST